MTKLIKIAKIYDIAFFPSYDLITSRTNSLQEAD